TPSQSSADCLSDHESAKFGQQRAIKNRPRKFLDAFRPRKRKRDFEFTFPSSTIPREIAGHWSLVTGHLRMFATLYLPNFYLQAAMRHHPKLRAQPVGLIDPSHKKVAIIELNDAAEKAGVVKGMTPSQALARCLQVAIRTRERGQEKLIDEILLQHAFMLSPFVE